MNKIIFKLIAATLMATAFLTSCKNEESLQQFYVDSVDKEGYITTSVPKTILGLQTENFSQEALQGYESIDKVNLIILPAKQDNADLYAMETEKLDKIFKNDKYELLIMHNSDDVKLKMMYDVEQKAIDEIIVYANSQNMGLGVARILGNDMNMGEVMKLVEEARNGNIDAQGIESMIGGFGFSNQKLEQVQN